MVKGTDLKSVPGVQMHKWGQVAQCTGIGGVRVKILRISYSDPNCPGAQENTAGLKSSALMMLALSPVARITNRPCRSAYFVTVPSAFRYATAP